MSGGVGWTSWGSLTPNISGNAASTRLATAPLPDGRSVVAWGSGEQVHLMVLGPEGFLAGAIQDITTASANVEAVTVSVLEDGTIGVAWVESTGFGPSTSHDFKARTVAPDGTLSLVVHNLGTQAAGALSPAIAMVPDGGGNFMVLAGSGPLLGYRLDPDGTPTSLGSFNGTGSQISALATGDGRIAATWTQEVSGTNSEIRFGVFSATNLLPLGTPVLANTTSAGIQRDPAIAMLADGRFVVAWTDASATGGDTDGLAVRAQIMGANGVRIGPEILVNTTTAGDQAHPTVTALLDGGFVIGWTSPGAVMAQSFDATGAPRGDEAAVPFGGEHLATTLLADGRLLATWADADYIWVSTPEARAEGVDINGSAGGDVLYGTGFEDTLAGGAGNDTLDGAGGGDLLIGGLGDDNLYGGAADDLLVGGAGDDNLWGDTGEDVLQGGSGNDQLDGGEGAGADLLQGGAGNDSLTGWDDDDVLEGGSGDDTLVGGAGNDVMRGGDGSDFYYVDDPLDIVVEAGADPDERDMIQTSLAAFSLAALPTVEDLVGTGEVAQALTGNDADNFLRGDYWDFGTDSTLRGAGGDDFIMAGGGNDSIDGGTGADLMMGGLGNDTYVVDACCDDVMDISGNDRVIVFVDNWFVPEEIERISLGGTAALDVDGNEMANIIDGNAAGNMLSGYGGNDSLYGNGGDDTLYGDEDDDWLHGGTGADQMEGGTGNDSYLVDNLLDVVMDTDGFDRVVTLVSDWSLPDEVEWLSARSGADINLTGNSLANRLDSGAGNGVLTGLGGNDSLYGNGGNDTLLGGADNDWLDGGTGADSMEGGLGNDTYVADSLADVVLDAGGYDRVSVLVDGWVAGAGIEYISLGGTANLTATGNDDGNRMGGNAGANTLDGRGGADSLFGYGGNDTLEGGLGADRIDGGTGADLMRGGQGDDTYHVDDAGDAISDDGGADRVVTAISWTLADGLEWLSLGGAAGSGTGNALANRIDGNAGDNTLDGAKGDDSVYAGAGADSLSGGEGNDRLDGNAGNDTLIGGEGNDYMIGGGDLDLMEGGAGNDIYRVDQIGDQVIDTAGVDRIIATLSWTLGDGIERLSLAGALDIDGTGTTATDTLDGSGGANLLAGLGGGDRLRGYAGADTLVGGEGADTLRGDGGADRFRFAAASEGGDLVTDFAIGTDRLEFSAVGFGAGLTEGMDLSAGRFVSGAGAVANAAVGQFLYQTDTGWLLWDADGTGAGAAQQIVRLSGVPALSASDLAIIA